MDIGIARTFLEVVKTGSFVRAAENLNLTQTAVSVPPIIRIVCRLSVATTAARPPNAVKLVAIMMRQMIESVGDQPMI